MTKAKWVHDGTGYHSLYVGRRPIASVHLRSSEYEWSEYQLGRSGYVRELDPAKRAAERAVIKSVRTILAALDGGE